MTDKYRSLKKMDSFGSDSRAGRYSLCFKKKKTKKNVGTFVLRVLVALAVVIIDQDSSEMREQSICRQVGSVYSQPSLAAR